MNRRAARLLGDAVGVRFNGNVQHAADACRMRITRAKSNGLAAVFIPDFEDGDLPGLILGRDAGEERREYFVTLALAHHLLRHHDREFYCYRVDGPAYDCPLYWNEAREFAEAFMAVTIDVSAASRAARTTGAARPRTWLQTSAPSA